jgi:hypothetical protein
VFGTGAGGPRKDRLSRDRRGGCLSRDGTGAACSDLVDDELGVVLDQAVSDEPREYWFFIPRKYSPGDAVTPRSWTGVPCVSSTGA